MSNTTVCKCVSCGRTRVVAVAPEKMALLQVLGDEEAEVFIDALKNKLSREEGQALYADGWIWLSWTSMYAQAAGDEEMTAFLRAAGFGIDETIQREPYPDVEHPSRRCYIVARKPA